MPSIFAYPRRLFKPFAKGGPLATSPSIGPMRQRLSKGQQPQNLEALTKRIILPSLPVTDEDLARLGLWNTGRNLARQDQWQQLADLIINADDARLCTPGGSSEATLLALGAQSDVTAAATDALADGSNPTTGGLEDLQGLLEEYPDNHAITLIVALAHINIGRAWLVALPDVPQLTSQHHAHFKQARALLDPLDANDLDAPSVAAAQAILAEMTCPDTPCIIKAYHHLLQLDADNPNHIRAYGLALMHELSDDPDLLDREAEKLIEETADAHGQAIYTWLYLDVLAQNEDALSYVDTKRFSQGLRDILRQHPDQHVINELAAFCAIAMRRQPDQSAGKPSDVRAALRDNLDWILSDHLSELHPMVWSDHRVKPVAPPRSTAPRALVAQGRKTALHVIAGRFSDQLADGSSIAFSPAGMYRLPAM